MEFNADKCEILRKTRKRHPLIYPYRLHNTGSVSATADKYLGVTITPNLNCSKHIENISSKATSSLRFVQRKVKTNNK